ncbi:MAG: hypothetical protein V1704_04560 [Candidatus Vogelbacteria bacterium]
MKQIYNLQFPISKLKIAIIFLCLILLGYFLFPAKKLSLPPSVDNSVIVMTPPTAQISETTRLYKNLLFRFSLTYPKDLEVKEYDDGSSASTITFEDEVGKNGFQIFIVPYTESQITPQQFKKDVPSGVMREPTDIIIGGIRATMFYSQDIIKNETREVWFIKNGFLYEITTYAPLDNWLAQILSTWQFD